LELIPPQRFSDFGRDILPAMLEQGLPLYGYKMTAEESLWWIDTPEDLERVRLAFAGAAAGKGRLL
jgi:NDP-sugar pyrophosphorylase family protein